MPNFAQLRRYNVPMHKSFPFVNEITSPICLVLVVHVKAAVLQLVLLSATDWVGSGLLAALAGHLGGCIGSASSLGRSLITPWSFFARSHPSLLLFLLFLPCLILLLLKA